MQGTDPFGRVDRTALLALWTPMTVLGVQALIVYFTITTAYLQGVFKVALWTPWAIAPIVPAVAALLLGIWYWRRHQSVAGAPRAEARRWIGLGPRSDGDVGKRE